MYHNGLRYGRIAALVLFTHIVMLLAVLFRGNYETIQDLAPLTIAVLGLDVVYIIVLRFFYKQMTYTTDFLLLLILNISARPPASRLPDESQPPSGSNRRLRSGH